MPFRIPPAGDPVVWGEMANPGGVRGLFAPWHPVAFGSARAALAALLRTLRATNAQRDEVVLAAYNCPALISAIEHAECTPVLVDLAPSKPWMDLKSLDRLVGKRTLAVIAVNLFGLYERTAQIKDVCRKAGCLLIEDSAQAFPMRASERRWEGDAVLLSFGRGKPVSLLGGGAVLLRERDLADEVAGLRSPPLLQPQRQRWSVRAYNLLRHPALYWIPAAIPALKLGATEYEPLSAIDGLHAEIEGRLPGAVGAYRHAHGAEGCYAATLAGNGTGVTDLPALCGWRRGERLSRYPVLAPDGATALALEQHLGFLGVSRLYGTTLPNIPDIAQRLGRVGAYPHAESFAERLITLPTHAGVRPRHAARLARALRQPVQMLAESF